MNSNVCPICGGKETLRREAKDFSAKYGLTEYITKVPVDVCSACGAKFDLGKKSENLKKEALIQARTNCVANTLNNLEKEMSFTDIERSLLLPSKTLSKWKNQSKAPSAAAAALVSLLGVFPWLSYVGMTNYEPIMAYKIAGAAFFNKATEDERIKAFYTSNKDYEIMGLISDKTVSNATCELPSLEDKATSLLAGGQYDC